MEKPGYIYLLRIGSPNLYRVGKASQGNLKQGIYGHRYRKDSAVTLVGFVQVSAIHAAKKDLIKLFDKSRTTNPSTQRFEHTFRFNDLSHVYREFASITRSYPISENFEFTEDVQGLSEDPQFIEQLEYWQNYYDSRDYEERRTEIHDQYTPNNFNDTFSTGSSYPYTSEIPWGPILVGGVILCTLVFLGVSNKIPSLSIAQGNSTSEVIPYKGYQKMNVRSCADISCDPVDSVLVGDNVTIVRRDVNGWSEIVTPQGKRGFIDPRSIK